MMYTTTDVVSWRLLRRSRWRHSSSDVSDVAMQRRWRRRRRRCSIAQTESAEGAIIAKGLAANRQYLKIPNIESLRNPMHRSSWILLCFPPRKFILLGINKTSDRNQSVNDAATQQGRVTNVGDPRTPQHRAELAQPRRLVPETHRQTRRLSKLINASEHRSQSAYKITAMRAVPIMSCSKIKLLERHIEKRLYNHFSAFSNLK